MKTSLQGQAEILSHEAIVTRRYKDSENVWTVGVGHTKAAGGVDPVTVKEDRTVAELVRLFLDDLPKYEAGVNRRLAGATVPQHAFDAMVSFHFNTGKIGTASFVKRYLAGNLPEAARSIMQWKRPPEIIGRRQAERDLLVKGVYSNDGKATVYPASDRGAVLWSKGKRVTVSGLLRPVSGEGIIPLPKPDPAAAATVAGGERGDLLKAVQQNLIDFGYHEVGIPDAEWGSRTRGAVLAYRADRGLPVDGKERDDLVNQALVDDMKTAATAGFKRRIAPARAEITKAEIAPTSATLQTSWWGKVIVGLGLGGGGIGQVVKQVIDPDKVEARLTAMQRVFDFLGDNWVMLAGIVVAGVGTWGVLSLIEHFRVQAVREGRIS